MIKKILITGTSSGLGHELAKKLSKKYFVFGLSRSVGKSKNLNFKKFKHIKLDLSNFEDLNKLKFSNIECLINNASIFSMKPFNKISNKEIIEIINTNLIGTILLTRKIIQKNKNLKKIINILSVSGLNGIKNQSIYSASKHGLKGFFDSLSQENLNKISINNIFPGGMKTELWNKYPKIKKKQYKGFLDTKDIAKYVQNILDDRRKIITKNITLFPNNDWH